MTPLDHEDPMIGDVHDYNDIFPGTLSEKVSTVNKYISLIWNEKSSVARVTVKEARSGKFVFVLPNHRMHDGSMRLCNTARFHEYIAVYVCSSTIPRTAEDVACICTCARNGQSLLRKTFSFAGEFTATQLVETLKEHYIYWENARCDHVK